MLSNGHYWFGMITPLGPLLLAISNCSGNNGLNSVMTLNHGHIKYRRMKTFLLMNTF